MQSDWSMIAACITESLWCYHKLFNNDSTAFNESCAAIVENLVTVPFHFNIYVQKAVLLLTRSLLSASHDCYVSLVILAPSMFIPSQSLCLSLSSLLLMLQNIATRGNEDWSFKAVEIFQFSIHVECWCKWKFNQTVQANVIVNHSFLCKS